MSDKQYSDSLVVWLEWPEECFRANDADIAYLKALAPRDARITRARSEAEFLAALPEATSVITWHFKGEWYARAPRLRLVATPAAGRELVDFASAPEGVRVHFGGFHGEIIAESVAAFILAHARGFFAKKPENGMWPREWLSPYCSRVAGTRAVIAGYGRIGKAIARKLGAFGVECEGFTRANVSRIKEAARTADWFILALPSDTGTDDFLDAGLIAALPARAVVVNVGRGNAVDESALKAALEEGRIAAAYLDVFKGEPTQLMTDASAADRKTSGLWESDVRNLTAMPHSSAFSPDYIRTAFKELKNEGLV